jgi:thymidylate synthase (FAD)
MTTFTKEIQVLDHGYIRVIEPWGSDERIIEAARMSTNKGFLGWEPGPCPACGGGGGADPSGCDGDNPACYGCDGKGVIKGDEKLLRFLFENHHDTPFEMAGMQIEVQAPLFVFREWHRHRTQSYNELSARYTQMPNLHYIPSRERLLAALKTSTNKQASGVAVCDLSDEEQLSLVELIRDQIESEQQGIYKHYEWLLSQGVSKEIARINTPVSRYSRMRASSLLRNWLAFLTLREASNAQWEIRQYAIALHTLLAEHFPRTLGLFEERIADYARFHEWKQASRQTL